MPRLPVIGIGASAGGLEALREMLAAVHEPTGMAFVIVQHLDPNHESMLAQLLDRHTWLEVRQCAGGEQLAPDNVYIIPPGHGLVIQRGVLELTDFAQPRGLRRPIDDFLMSLAQDQQADAACVILSGTGADGTTGLRAVKEHGGVSVVQSPESARYDGMPLSAVGTGLVDFVRPPGEIVACLRGYFQHGPATTAQADVVADHLDELCRTLRQAVGHDFSGYKRTTLVRRVERRMNVLGIATGRAYLERVRGDAVECEALFRDLLINVTRFFRDTEWFDRLRERVVEPLVRDRAPGEEIRVWIPGCSSGEEAYSIAMLFAEAARERDSPPVVQIFATDIDERMLQTAREAVYPSAALADLPAALRERYTLPKGERFVIDPKLRDLIRFSNHSLVKDPPFSRLDLVSCRNLLIYFNDSLQQTVLPLLHYALRPGGFLFLGPSESIGRFETLFRPLDHQARIFERAPGAPSYPIDLAGGGGRDRRRDERPGRRDLGPAAEAAALRRLAERYGPASMVLDGEGAILSAHGRLSRYFDFPVSRSGGSSALTLARPGLRDVLGPLLRQGREGRQRVVSRDVEVRSEYGLQRIEVICDPLPDGHYLCIFRDTGPFQAAEDPDLIDLDQAGGDHLEALEDDLRQTRHRLRAAVEELETANEELKSSNEEMMSMNEELQSTNEELSTVNDELKSKVDQLSTLNSDLRNFFESTDLAVIVLDRQLRIRSYTEAARTIFPLQPSDRGRPLGDVTCRLSGDAWLEDARAVAAGGVAMQRRVWLREGERTYSLRTVPYSGHTGQVEGATLVLTEITEALAMERQVSMGRQRLDLALVAGRIGVWEFTPDTGEVRADSMARALMELPPESGRVEDWTQRVEPEDRATVEAAAARVAAGAEEFEAAFRIRLEGGGFRRIKSIGRVMGASDPRRITGVCIDVTAEYTLAETRELMLREMNHRVKNLFAMISGMVAAGARMHDDLGAFAADLRDRIAALGRAHALASHDERVHAVELEGLIATTLAPYRGHAEVVIEGPEVRLRQSALSSFALILHEWATNSVKYGALGAADGRLSVHWRPAAEGVVLDWEETAARIAPAPERRGFGSLLAETSARQIGASVNRAVEPGHFSLSMQLPPGVTP